MPKVSRCFRTSLIMEVGSNVWGTWSRQIYVTIYTCRSVSGFNEICTVWPSIMTFTLQFFQGLTFKIGNVKRMSPASKAGLFKMDYLISVILDPSYCQWKWLNHSCHLLIDKNSKLSLDKWTTSVQHDPRRDGQRNQNLRGHPTVGVRKVKTWTWHENNSFSENPMSLSKCKESFAILSLRGSFPRHKLTEPWHKHGTNNPTNSIGGL